MEWISGLPGQPRGDAQTLSAGGQSLPGYDRLRSRRPSSVPLLPASVPPQSRLAPVVPSRSCATTNQCSVSHLLTSSLRSVDPIYLHPMKSCPQSRSSHAAVHFQSCTNLTAFHCCRCPASAALSTPVLRQFSIHSAATVSVRFRSVHLRPRCV